MAKNIFQLFRKKPPATIDTTPATVTITTGNSVSMIVGGSDVTLSYSVSNATGGVIGSATVTWTSADASIASVNSSTGVVHAVAAPATTLGSDTMSRADDPTALGTADAGGAWTAQAGTWGILNGRGYSVSGANNDRVTQTYATPPVEVGAQFVTDTIETHCLGLLVRYVDSSNFLSIQYENALGSGTFRLVSTVAGVGTQRAVSADLALPTSGAAFFNASATIDPLTNVVRMYLEGAQYGSDYTLTSTEMAAFGAGLKAGIKLNWVSGTNTATTFDNWYAKGRTSTVVTATSTNGHTGTTTVFVAPDATPASVVMTPNTLTLTVGGADTNVTSTVFNSASGAIAGASVTYSSSTPTFFTVGSSSGVVHAVAQGNGILTATTSNGLTDTTTVTIAADTVPAAVTMLPATATITVGGATQTFVATATNAAGAALPGASITYTSNNSAAATITPDTGVATAVAAGSATITATTGNGKTTTSALTVVANTTPNAITVSPTTMSLSVGGADGTITPTVTNAQGAVLSGASVTYTSGATGVATVGSTTGVVHAVGVGSATITATTSNSHTATCAVSVVTPPATPTSIVMSPSTLALVVGGSDVTMTSVVSGSSGVISGAPVSYTSSATGVATVTVATGIVHAVVAGTATITGTTSNGITATSSVTVSLAGQRTMHFPNGARVRLIARQPSRDNTTDRAFINSHYDDIEDTGSNGTLAGHPNAISVQHYGLLAKLEVDSGSVFTSDGAGGGTWNYSHNGVMADGSIPATSGVDISAAYATANGIDDETMWLHVRTGDQNKFCGITSISSAGAVVFNNPMSAGQCTSFPFAVGMSVTLTGLSVGNGAYTIASLQQKGVTLTGWSGGDLSVGATPNTSKIGTLYVPGTGVANFANRKWFFVFSEWRMINYFGNADARQVAANRFKLQIQNAGSPINSVLIDEMDGSIYQQSHVQSMEYPTSGWASSTSDPVICQYTLDINAALAKIRADNPGIVLRINTASYAFANNKSMVVAAGGAHQEQLLTIFAGDTGWLDFWISCVNAGADCEFVDGGTWLTAANNGGVTPVPGVMQWPSTFVAGNYPTSSARRQMTAYALYLMGMDATQTLADGTTRKHAIIDLSNSNSSDVPISAHWTPAFEYPVGQPMAAYVKGAAVSPPTGQAVRPLSRSFSMDGGATANACAVIMVTSGTPPAGVTATNYDDTSLTTFTLPTPPSGKAWHQLGQDGTVGTNGVTTVSIRRAEGVVFVAQGSALHVASNGNDSTGNGTTTTPYLTGAKAIAVSPAGGTIHFRGGDSFRETLTATKTGLTFGSYGTGLATISGADVFTGWALNGVGANTYSVAATTQPLMVYTAAGRMTLGSSASALTDQQWWWGSNVLYFRNDAGNPDTTGAVIEASQRTQCVKSNGFVGIAVQNLIIQRSQHTTTGAIYYDTAGTLDGLSVTGCTIQGNYTTGLYIHQDSALGTVTNNTITDNGQHGVWYASGGPPGSTNQTITGNTVTNNGWRFDGAINFPSGIIGAVRSGVVAFNTCTNNGISGGGSHAHGIYLSSDLAPGLSLLVHDNTCTGQTQGYGIKVTQDATVYNNTLHDNAWGGLNFGQNAGTNNVNITAHHNLIYTSSSAGGAGIQIQNIAGSGTLSFSGYNNTLYHNSSGSSAGELFINSNLATFNWKNNIVYASGTSARHIRAVTQSGTIGIDYNDYFNGDASTPFTYNGSSMSLATWKGQAFTPDAHAITGDPLFIVSGTPAFSLQATSPCINAGTPVTGITTGFIGTAPDMGFLEKA